MGIAIEDTERGWPQCPTSSVTLAKRSEHNLYTAALFAILEGVKQIPSFTYARNIHIFSSDRGALQAICQPRDQSGQETIRQIYQGIRMLQVHNHVQLAWSPVLGFDLGQKAKQAAKIATEPNRTPQRRTPAALSTVINQQRTR